MRCAFIIRLRRIALKTAQNNLMVTFKQEIELSTMLQLFVNERGFECIHGLFVQNKG